MPVDPFTHRSDTWIFDQGNTLTTVDETQSGIDDVHSGAQDVSTEGTTYNHLVRPPASRAGASSNLVSWPHPNGSRYFR